MKTLLFRCCIVVLVLAGSFAVAVAQTANTSLTQARRTTGAKVLVLQVDQLPSPGARAVVIRRPATPVSHDIILVSAATSSSDLARAVATVMFSRRTHGTSVSREMRADIAPSTDKAKGKNDDEKLAERDLRRLQRAKAVTVEGVGRGRAIAVTPAQVTARKK
jgi:H+/gluconate symporter-like permease